MKKFTALLFTFLLCFATAFSVACKNSRKTTPKIESITETQIVMSIEATIGTANFLKEHGIRTRVRRKLSEGSEEILDSIRAGYVSYVINTRAILSGVHYEDGAAIRRCAIENNVTVLSSLDTVKVLLDVLEEVTIGISKIDD